MLVQRNHNNTTKVKVEVKTFGQWQVLANNDLYCPAAGYSIPLDELRIGTGTRSWVEHLSEKNWFDLGDFRAACGYVGYVVNFTSPSPTGESNSRPYHPTLSQSKPPLKKKLGR